HFISVINQNSSYTFDIWLSKDIYYSGENISGNVILENSQNILIKDIRVILRGRAHTRIKLNKAGERRTVQDNQYILNEKLVVWDQEKCDEKDKPILFSGLHQFPFQFLLPHCPMPCSLETKFGTIRYYVKVIINIPHGSMPQGIKYFTIIGPSTDCMDEKYCCALLGQNKEVTWHGCCRRGGLALRVIMDRTAYLCGENVRILAHVENRQDGIVWIAMRLTQHVEYFVEKNAGENKQIACVVLETKTLPVQPYTQGKFDTAQLQSFVLPVVPPTLVGVCRLLQIFYVFQVTNSHVSIQLSFFKTLHSHFFINFSRKFLFLKLSKFKNYFKQKEK
uniref:Arrestin_C domain-containing protein n=1 Tax=Elaeophora elaphi TaxID=1147741 RepID=A0A0R3S451_9BILA